MKVMCKDQATKDLLLKAIDEFPDAFGHISKTDILVFGPDTLDIMLDKRVQVNMLDLRTIQALYDTEVQFAQDASTIDEFTRARMAKLGKLGMAEHQCRNHNQHRDVKEIMLLIENTPENEDWPERIEKAINPREPLPREKAEEIQLYLSSVANGSGRVTVTKEILLRLESISRKEQKVALLGGVLGSINVGAIKSSIYDGFIDERAFIPKLQNTDFGRESGKQSRRPMVTSASGHPYPLPKGPRGMPRNGRTRGR